MYKRGVITDEISQDFDVAAKLAVKYSLDGVEIRSVWEKNPHELGKNDIAAIKSILKETNLEVCGISSPFYKCDMENDAEIKEHIRILEKSINLAHALDTDIVRGFTFWKKGSFSKNFDRIVSMFREPVKLLENEGITMALEFDPSVYASNAAKLIRIIEAIDSPSVKALWDPGNDIYDPDDEVPYPDGYEIIKHHMVHMHLKDAVKHSTDNIEGVPIGEGQVAYDEQFKTLKRDKYKGYVVLETHYRPKHEISEKLMKLPKGSSFSYMGYEATEECLVKWDDLIKNI